MKSREPKQARSRQSLEKVLEATLALLEERGNDEFTLADVSALSAVSIGSIYARFKGKDELIRVAHNRKLDDIDAESSRLFEALPTNPGEGLESVLREAVDETILILRRHAGILRPLLILAARDETISQRGRASHAALAAGFAGVLGIWSDGNLKQDDVDWSFNVIYSVIAQRLGLGSTVEASGAFGWSEIAEKLAGMVAPYLIAGLPDSLKA